MSSKRQKGKTYYIQAEHETNKDFQRREKKVITLAKRLKDTQSAAIRTMIDAYEIKE